MTISFGAIGAKQASGTTTVAIAYPSSPAANNVLVAGRTIWRDSATATDESGWDARGDLGGGALGSNTTNDHKTRIRVDTKIATGSESGSVTFDQANTPVGVIGVMARYAGTLGGTWSIASATGDDATHGANRSATASSSIDFAPGDMLIAVAASDWDGDHSAASAALTASGITFGTTNQRTSGTGSGTDINGNIFVFDAVVSSGSGTVAPTLAFNVVQSQCGPVSFVRLRENAIALTVQDATHAQSTDSIALTQAHSLAVDDATQAQATDAVALTQVHSLSVADATQAHSADEVTLTQVHVLTVQDAAQAHTAENVVLTVGGIDLVVQDATHGHTADTVILTQAHTLVVQDAGQAQAADAVALTQAHQLAPADASQAQAADSVTLTQAHVLEVQDALHAHSADSVQLTQAHTLVVQDAHHAHSTDPVELVALGPVRDIELTTAVGARRLGASTGTRRTTTTPGSRRLTATGG